MFKSTKGWKLATLYFYVIIISLSGYAAAESLHECALEGDLEKANHLIGEGANVNIVDTCGATPLHFAADRGHKEVVKLLISKGADVNAVTNLLPQSDLWFDTRFKNAIGCRYPFHIC